MADFDADAVREQMARAIAPGGEGRWGKDDAAAALPIAAQAVTDVVRALHQPHDCGNPDHECFIVHGGSCTQAESCEHCRWPYPCPTVRLCDEIDKAAGVRRD